MTFGFIDNDKYNDLVVTNSEMNALQVHFFKPEIMGYIPSESFKVDESSPKA